MKPIILTGNFKLIKEFEDFIENEGCETDLKLKESSLNLDGGPDLYLHLITALSTPLVTLLTTYIIQHNNKRRIKLIFGPNKDEIEIEGSSASEIESLLNKIKDVISLDISQAENKK